MAFKGRKLEIIDFESLQITLVNSRLQQSNPALYILLNQLISRLKDNKQQVDSVFNSIIGSIDIDSSSNLQSILRALNNSSSASYLTWEDNSALYLNSRQLIAGTGIQFDDTTTNQRIVNSTGGFSWIPMVTGAEPLEIMSNGAGDLLLIAYIP